MRRIALSVFAGCAVLLAADTFTQRQRDFWSFQPVKPQTPPAVTNTLVGAQSDRSLHAGQAGSQGHRPGPARRQDHAAAPRHLRPDRPAAHAGRGRRVPRGPVAAGVRESGGPAAGLAALRRALGPALARPGALRRERRLQGRRDAAQRLALSRLRDPVVQRRQAVRPLRAGADRGRRTVAGRSARRASPPASTATIPTRATRATCSSGGRKSSTTSPTPRARCSWA